MSEDSSSATSSNAGTPTAASRRKPSRTGNRPGSAKRNAPTFGDCALPSAARADNPSVDDPYHSGQRVWPD